MISFALEIIQVQCREWEKGHWVNAVGPSRGRDDGSSCSNVHKLKCREVMDWRWVVTSRTGSRLLAYAVVRKGPTDSDRAYGRVLGGRLWVWLWMYWVLAAFEIPKWNVQWSVECMRQSGVHCFEGKMQQSKYFVAWQYLLECRASPWGKKMDQLA